MLVTVEQGGHKIKGPTISYDMPIPSTHAIEDKDDYLILFGFDHEARDGRTVVKRCKVVSQLGEVNAKFRVLMEKEENFEVLDEDFTKTSFTYMLPNGTERTMHLEVVNDD